MVISLVNTHGLKDVNELEKNLKIYQTDKLETSTMIWTNQMRKHLELEIWNNQKDFIVELYEFVNKNKSELVKEQKSVPNCDKRLKNCVTYTEINQEIRCGQYYLRIWAEKYRD